MVEVNRIMEEVHKQFAGAPTTMGVGILPELGETLLLGILLPENNPIVEGILTGVLLLGFGLTFGALWLLREKHTTAWARYPAIGLLVAAVLAFIFGSIFSRSRIQYVSGMSDSPM